jgi:hypothetical protein
MLSATADALQPVYTYSASNHLFSLETNTSNKIPTWTRLSDGPAGAAIFDFAMVAVDGFLWIHGGETNDGETRSTLWSVQVFDDVEQSMYGWEHLWSVRGFGGMAARKRHCAAAIGNTVYFWGGLAGPLCVVCICAYSCGFCAYLSGAAIFERICLFARVMHELVLVVNIRSPCTGLCSRRSIIRCWH